MKTNSINEKKTETIKNEETPLFKGNGVIDASVSNLEKVADVAQVIYKKIKDKTNNKKPQ